VSAEYTLGASMYEKERGEHEIASEARILPINNGTGFTLKVTATV